MVVTINWIESKYNIFNKLYFDNKLPKLSFKISRSKYTWGYASYLIKNSKIIPEYISISNYYDSPEYVKEATLLHEMIHVKDYTEHPEHFLVNGRKNRWYDAHGTWFKKEAAKFIPYGYDIEKTVTKEEMDASTHSFMTLRNIERKRNTTRIFAIYGNNNKVWFCKTSQDNVSTILKNTIECEYWFIKYLDGIKEIKLFSTDSEKYVERKSCNKKLSGWTLEKSLFKIESSKNNFEFIKQIDY